MLLLYIASFLIKFILLALIIFTFTYQSGKTKILSAPVILSVILALVVAERWTTMDKLYVTMTMQNKYFSKGIWDPDPKMGHVGIPHASGYYGYSIGDSIEMKVPVHLNPDGFRTAENYMNGEQKPQDLFLGCSFTFGDFLPAEQTFPYLTAQRIGHNYDNTGASAYGLVQMYLRAKELLPKQQYSYVFIQYSPWLADRAMSLTGPTLSGYYPFPYFSDKGGVFESRPVAFNSSFRGNEINLKKYRGRSYDGKWEFIGEVGIPVEIFDFTKYHLAHLKTKVGLLPKPTTNKNDLEQFVYHKIIEEVRLHGAEPVVLCIDCNLEAPFLENLDAKIIDIGRDIRELTDDDPEKRKKMFQIHYYTGTDSVWVDGHPNQKAHEIYSQTILNNLTTH